MMKQFRIMLVAMVLVAVAGGVVIWNRGAAGRIGASAPITGNESDMPASSSGPTVADPNAAFIDLTQIADGGIGIAIQFMGDDPTSLRELREAVEARGSRALAEFQTKYEQLQRLPDAPLASKVQLRFQIGTLLVYEGRLDEAVSTFEELLELGQSSPAQPRQIATLHALVGIVALRQGEVENCIECSMSSSRRVTANRDVESTGQLLVSIV